MGAKASKPTRKQVGSFFHGMTGWMTAAAGLIVAVVGALTAFNLIPHSPSADVSAAKWAAQANKICGQINDEIKSLPQPSSFYSNLTAAVSYSRSAENLGDQMLRQLTALKVPSEKEQQVTQFKRLLAAENDGIHTLVGDLAVIAAEHKAGKKVDLAP
jgi:hypothetical protein